MDDMETCSWCCTEWKFTRLREAGPDGALICPDCLQEWRELKRQQASLKDRKPDRFVPTPVHRPWSR